MHRGCIVAAGHAQEIFEDVRLDAACGVRFEHRRVGSHYCWAMLYIDLAIVVALILLNGLLALAELVSLAPLCA
jgi:hypothetical protein